MGILMRSFLVKGLQNDPPASPREGDAYIIGAIPTGAWAGQQPGSITIFGSRDEEMKPREKWWDTWEFILPKPSYYALLINENLMQAYQYYKITGWERASAPAQLI